VRSTIVALLAILPDAEFAVSVPPIVYGASGLPGDLRWRCTWKDFHAIVPGPHRMMVNYLVDNPHRADPLRYS